MLDLSRVPFEPYYSKDGITIYNADCRDVLPHLPKFDLLLTDPPFSEVTHANARSNSGKEKAIDFESIDFDVVNTLLAFASKGIKRWTVSFLDWRHVARLETLEMENLEFVRFGVWMKSNPMPQITGDRPANGWDAIAYLHSKATKKKWSGGGNHGNYYGPVVSNGVHPTQKPMPFIRTIIARHSEDAETVLDPFMGSGTTLVACKLEGRQAVGIELDEKYCEIAVKRLKQGVLF